MSEEKRVRLRIVSTMTEPDGERHEIKRATTGLLRVDAGETRLEYEEEQDGERARITLHAANGQAQMLRRGMTSARLIFSPGQRTSSAYVTPYGDIPVAVDTRGVQLEDTPVGGRLTLHYDVYVSGERTASTVLCVTWRT